MRIFALVALVCSASLICASSWEAGPSRPVACEAFGSARVGEMFFTLGGTTVEDTNTHTSEVWILDLSSGLWTAGVDMPDARYKFQAVAVEDCLYFAGGGLNGVAVATSYMFNTTSSQWATLNSMPSTRVSGGAAVYDGDLASGYCVIGGYYGSALTTVECYDIAMNSWVTAPSLNAARDGTFCANFQGSLYAFGGHDGDIALASVEVWSGSANSSWEYAQSIPEPLNELRGALVGSSGILLVGGGPGAEGVHNGTENTGFTNNVFLFDFNDQSYTPVLPYPLPIKQGGATNWNGAVTYTGGDTPTSSDSSDATAATYILYAPTPTPAPAPPTTDSVAEQVANVAVPVAVAGAEVTAAAISLAPTLLAAAHGLATTTQPLSVSPLIWITFAYTQHIAMTIFFPGSLPDTYNTYASLFSWTIGMAPFGITFPFQPTDPMSGTTSTSFKRGNGLSRKLLDVDAAVAEFQLSETQLLAAMLFWVLMLLLVAVTVVPLVTATILTVQRNRLAVRLHENSVDGLSEQNPLVEKNPSVGSFTLQEENQSRQPDPGRKERPGLRDCLQIEASKPLDTRKSSYAWFAVCFLSTLVLVSASVLSLFYSSLLTLCATQVLLPWTYGGNLGTMDKVMITLAVAITFVVGLGVPLWSAAAACVVRSDKDPSIEKELSMVPSVRKFKDRTAFFGLVIYGSLFANAWLVAVFQNQALAFYAASVLVQMFVFCGIFFTRPYKQKVVFAWQLVSSAAITLRLVFLTILMYQEGEGTTVSWVLVALPIILDTFVVCGTLLMSVKGFLVAVWKMCRSRCCKSSGKVEDENASL